MELDEGSRSSERSAGGPDRRRHSTSSSRKRGDRDPYGLEDWRSHRNERASKRVKRSRDDGDGDGAAAAAAVDEHRRCGDGDLVSGSAPPPKGPGDLAGSPIPKEHAADDPAVTQSITAAADEPCSVCLVLHNVFETSGEEDPEFYLDIRDSVHARCAQFGPVYHMHIDKDHGSVYLEFGTKRICTLARRGFHESLIDGRVITATFMSSRLYNDKFRPGSWAEPLA